VTKLGIVGSEASRWTTEGEAEARELIRFLLSFEGITEIISGGCPNGGVDQWAAEIGGELGMKVTEFLPKDRSWQTGFKPRNLQIARESDAVHCITVSKIPEGAIVTNDVPCFHCGADDHRRNGGCWTVKRAREMGKPVKVHVIQQADAIAVHAKEEAVLMVDVGTSNPASYLQGCFNRLFRSGGIAGYDTPLNRERFLRIAMAEAKRIIAEVNIS